MLPTPIIIKPETDQTTYNMYAQPATNIRTLGTVTIVPNTNITELFNKDALPNTGVIGQLHIATGQHHLQSSNPAFLQTPTVNNMQTESSSIGPIRILSTFSLATQASAVSHKPPLQLSTQPLQGTSSLLRAPPQSMYCMTMNDLLSKSNAIMQLAWEMSGCKETNPFHLLHTAFMRAKSKKDLPGNLNVQVLKRRTNSAEYISTIHMNTILLAAEMDNDHNSAVKRAIRKAVTKLTADCIYLVKDCTSTLSSMLYLVSKESVTNTCSLHSKDGGMHVYCNTADNFTAEYKKLTMATTSMGLVKSSME